MIQTSSSPKETQHSALSTQHSALSTQHSALAPQHSALAPQHSALSPQHSALAPQHSALSPQHSSLAPQHSALSTQHFLSPHTKIFIAGHRGMVGSAIVRLLQAKGYHNLIVKTREELDLTNQSEVHGFLAEEKPDYIFLAAARVGGIHANNTFRADFIYENLIIETNIIHAAWKAGVNRLLFLGSSCIYPRDCPQPIREEYLLTGPLEQTNEPYAIAKIAGIKLCESYNRQYGTGYVSVMPTNLYGPNDTYDLLESHVLPALIRKAHEAKLRGEKSLTVWGTGTPKREFLYVDDMAEACIFLMESGVTEGLFNIGSGCDVTIRELAETVMDVVGFKGTLTFDTSRPDGTPRKLLDVSSMKALGWQSKTTLQNGIAKAYADFLTLKTDIPA